MPRNNRPIIIGAAVLGALALGLTMLMMLSGRNTAPPPGPAPVQPVIKQVVATRAIPPRTLITRDMLTEETTEKLAPNAVTDINEAVGKLSSVQINPRTPIQNNSYTTSLQRVVPANFAIPDGFRGVAVFVDPASTAAGLVDVGDRVDVVVNHKGKLIKSDTESTEQLINGPLEVVTGRTIAQDLLVLAVDKSLAAPTPTPTPVPGAPPVPASAPPPPPPAPPASGAVAKTRVLLAATPQVAERLVAANESGNLHLMMRNPNSRERVIIAEATEYPTRVRTVPKTSYQDKRRADIEARQEKRARLALEAMKEMRANRDSDNNRNNGGNRNNTSVFPNPSPPMTPVQQPLPPMQPSVTGNNTLPPPSGPSGSEVTIIRGTEKTRVIVPGR